MHDDMVCRYEPNLGARELDRTLDELLGLGRRCEWLVCRYLADIDEGRRFRQLGWYSDVLDYARARFGLGVKTTRERVRIGRALRELPLVEQAFVRGELGYSKVRELTRVATRQTEGHWVELGRRLGMRELERRVAGQVGGEALTGQERAEVHWTTPESVELRLHLPAATWALLSRAIEGARQAAETPLSDAEALEAVAREALRGLCEPDSAHVADPRKAVVLYRCRDCRRTELETGRGAVALPPAQAERLSSGAKVVDLATEGVGEACDGSLAMPAAVRRAVLARDRGRCRVCGRRRYVDVHHLRARSRGGQHSRSNCACLCSACHGALHEGALRAEGDAESGLRFFGAQGQRVAGEPDNDRADGPGLSPDAALVVRAMGGRGGWTADALVEATGLPGHRVLVALGMLELGGQVRQQSVGVFAPVGAELGSGHACARPGADAPIGASARTASSRTPTMGLGGAAPWPTALR